jgi:CRP/FNR family transcriptional regulator
MEDDGATRTIESLLARAALFRRLSHEDRRRLARVTVVKSYQRGDVVFREGEDALHLYTVLNGRVKAVKLMPSGQEVILEIFGAGDPLGAVAVYEGRPYPASAVVMAEAACLRIERAAFFALLEEHPTLVRGVLSGLNLRLVELTRRITELMGGRVENRLARLLVRLGREFGQPAKGGLFVPMSLTRQELADMTGTTVETCIRVMSRWSKDNLVLTEEGGFRIVNLTALELLAQS